MRKGELKTTTNNKMEKKETKEALYIYIYIYFFFFFLLWKAYERKENFLVYCKALHFYSKKRYTLLFFLYRRRKCYTLEVEDDNDWASIAIHE